MDIKLHKDAEFIIETLNSCGFSAYAVGGCVRDAIMNRRCDDTDITTNALPEQTKSVFSAYTVIETGIKHGTVTLLLNGKPYEITTFRKESNYTDSRHPDEVTFVTDIKDDLSRRDFTVNAIAFSHKEGIKDFYGGIDDINNKIIRTVGSPSLRFAEDALRILRALRFASTLGFEIEKGTSDAIKALAETVNKVSGERVFTEIKKLLCGVDAQRIIDEYIEQLSMIIRIKGDYKSVCRLPCDYRMRLACLCGEGIEETLACLRADNKTKHDCRLLVNSEPIPSDIKELRKYISSIGREDALMVAAYRRSLYNEDEEMLTEAVVASDFPLFISELAVNGRDLRSIGISGRDIGATLSMLLGKVMDNELPNEKQALLASLDKYAK